MDTNGRKFFRRWVVWTLVFLVSVAACWAVATEYELLGIEDGAFSYKRIASLFWDSSGTTLEIPGTVKITGGSPGADKILTSDTDGDGSWVKRVYINVNEDDDTNAISRSWASDHSVDNISAHHGIYSTEAEDETEDGLTRHWGFIHMSSGRHHTKTGVDDTAADGDVTDAISSNWAFDHDAAASPDHDLVTLTGTPDYITLANQVITRGLVVLTTDVSGVLPDGNVANDITLTNLTQVTSRNHSDTQGKTADDHHNEYEIVDSSESATTANARAYPGDDTDGGHFTIDGGDANDTDGNGGNITLTPGMEDGDGNTGNVNLKKANGGSGLTVYGSTGFVGMAGSASVASYLYVDGTLLYVDAGTDRVGIGTIPTASARLHVDAGTENIILRGETSSGSAYWDFVNTYADGDVGLRFDVGGTNWIFGVDDGAGDRFVIGTGSLVSSNPRFVIETDNTFGMGIANPFDNVAGGASDYGGTGAHLRGAATTRLIIEGTAVTLEMIDLDATTNERIMSLVSFSGNTLFRSRNDVLGTVKDNIINMDHASGDVGVGKAPVYRLDVYDFADESSAMKIFNDGDDESNRGLIVQCGLDTYADGGGSIFIDFHDGDGTWIGDISADNVTALDFDIGSDRKLKRNIRDTAMRSSEIIRALRVRDYERLSSAAGTTETGVVAQEVEAFYPAAVRERMVDLDGNPSTAMESVMMIRPRAFTWLLLEETRRQRVEIDEMQAVVAQMDQRIKALEGR